MSVMDPATLLTRLLALPRETEWVEWKENDSRPDDIGEYLSALSNAAALHGKDAGYLVWGIRNTDGLVVGTTFRPREKKIGNQELENWLAMQLTPPTSFRIHELVRAEGPVVIIEVAPATSIPVRFKDSEFIRVGTYKKKLKDHSDKERELWKLFARTTFEGGIARGNVAADEVLSLLDYPVYFDVTKQALPENRSGILERLAGEQILVAHPGGTYDITNLGAILFAKRLTAFDRLARKALRVVMYRGNNRVETIREQAGVKGYAVGYEGAIGFINSQLPQNEQVGPALRREVRMYPEVAVRELVANAIIHQDFAMTGTGPMVEIFSDRIEITNPGQPLVDTMRFIDSPPRSRNEALAAFMRRINVCEERGSGIDKVIAQVELFQLPPPDFSVVGDHTRAVLFAYKKLAQMDKLERIRACYQHACLCWVSNQNMTNATLRKRFAISDENYPAASRIIADAVEAGLIKPFDPDNRSRKHARYVPFWG
ncbi:Divergent AAA domain protein [Phycisphaerae bacterium RAS1]|nr:Divergent AAA domain protein [Phycisphaerae bacterium RAS1]